ncbi:YdcF family protein [Candidatus Berkelbacteria bacterium]|nr:YdcF family protein [Candidatus Berkelbacteria bacterium]
MIDQEVDRLAKILWDFGQMHHLPEKADAIVVFGSYNPIVGKRAAELFLQGFAPIVVISGNRSDSTSNWEKTEAETLAEVVIEAGVPKNKILLETNATNSGENTQLTKELFEKLGINAKKIIVIQKPYAERRTYATVRKQWPDVEIIMASPEITFEEYMQTSPIGKDGSINTIVGDTQRIKLYAEKGFQIPMDIPSNVWSAYVALVNLGYNKSLVK